MLSKIRQLGLLSAVVAVGAALGTSATAQSAVMASAPNNEDVLRLENVSARTLVTVADWADLAESLIQAAGLRANGDPLAVRDLVAAASAFNAIDRWVDARTTVLEAASRAVAAGEIDQAAHAYIAAAILSIRLREIAAAWTYVQQARLLAADPALSRQQQENILRHLPAPRITPRA